MKAMTLTTALACAALSGLIAVGAARAQTAEPAAPQAPAAAAPAATPAPAAPANAAAPAAAPAKAAAAPKKAKAAKKKEKAAGGSGASVTMMNSRSVDLTELQAAPSGSDKFKKVLGAVKAGKKAGAQVPRNKDCQIDLHATFADGGTTDASGVDVCKTRTLNLTD